MARSILGANPPRQRRLSRIDQRISEPQADQKTRRVTQWNRGL